MPKYIFFGKEKGVMNKTLVGQESGKKLVPSTCLVLIARKLDPGGSERQLVALSKELKARGYMVHVLLFYKGGMFDDELAAAGVPLYYLGKKGRWDVFSFFWRFVAIARRLNPAVVYSFLDVPNIMALLLRPFIKQLRVVWSIRAAFMEMQQYDWMARLVPALENRLCRGADCIIANSRAGRDWAVRRSFPADKLCVIENGIDTERFCPNPKARENVRQEWGVEASEKLVGLPARLDPMKDHRTFLKACASVASRREDIRFVCVGGGPERYRAELIALANRLGLADRLTWAGRRTDMPSVYCGLDIVASSSSFGEGFPNVVAEAMSCGVPCVVTDVGDSARIVGEVGEVVPPRDAEALAAALNRMLSRTDEDAELRRLARQRIVGKFSMQRMVSQTEKVLCGND